MSDSHIISNPADILAYLISGNATVTLKSLKTSTHLTFKVSAPYANNKRQHDSAMRFVKVLHSGDEWSYIGFLNTAANQMVAGKKGKPNSTSFKALAWLLNGISAGAALDAIEVWHEGACGRCGRKLTDPTSIARGIGPECFKK